SAQVSPLVSGACMDRKAGSLGQRTTTAGGRVAHGPSYFPQRRSATSVTVARYRRRRIKGARAHVAVSVGAEIESGDDVAGEIDSRAGPVARAGRLSDRMEAYHEVAAILERRLGNGNRGDGERRCIPEANAHRARCRNGVDHDLEARAVVDDERVLCLTGLRRSKECAGAE